MPAIDDHQGVTFGRLSGASSEDALDQDRARPSTTVEKSGASGVENLHDGVVPDLLWDDVKDWFDVEWNGLLPDVCVPDTTMADWQSVVDLVRSKAWAYEYSEDGRVLRVPGRVEAMFSRAVEAGVVFKVWPVSEALAIFRPYSAEEISFDVDLRELQGWKLLGIQRAMAWVSLRTQACQVNLAEALESRDLGRLPVRRPHADFASCLRPFAATADSSAATRTHQG